jgi:hypothetical protein
MQKDLTDKESNFKKFFHFWRMVFRRSGGPGRGDKGIWQASVEFIRLIFRKPPQALSTNESPDQAMGWIATTRFLLFSGKSGKHFRDSVVSNVKAILEFFKIALNAKRMPLKIGILLICAIGGIITVYFLRRDPRLESPIQTYSSSSFPFYHSPFYFSFRDRNTTLMTPMPFSGEQGTGRYNSHSFRTPEYTVAHPPGTFRIVILGNSMAWGKGVSQEEAFPNVLEQSLSGMCQGLAFEVISLGIPGYGAGHVFISLLAHGQSLKPDLVVIQLEPGLTINYGLWNMKKEMIKERGIEQNKKEQLVTEEALNKIQKWASTKSVPVVLLLDYGATLDGRQTYGMPVLRLKGNNKARLDAAAHRSIAARLHEFLLEKQLIGCSGRTRNDPRDLWTSENLLRNKAANQWSILRVVYKEQVSLYQSLHELHPEDPWITNHLAFAQLLAGQREKSFSTYNRLAGLAPDFAAPWYLMSLCSSDPKQKMELMERMLQSIPEHTMTMNELGIRYLEQNRLEEGCRLLQPLTDTDSTFFPTAKQLFSKNGCTTVLSN